MDWFTSDLHIVEEHDTQILLNWNAIISPEDTVYILGDLCMGGNEAQWNRIYKVLNGNKKFIWGNHDTTKKIERYINEYKMEDLGLASLYRYSKKRNFYLSHYPKENNIWKLWVILL